MPCWCLSKPKYPRHSPRRFAQDNSTRRGNIQGHKVSYEIRNSRFLLLIDSPIRDGSLLTPCNQ